VHGVGGLSDTIEDGINGFIFEGRTPTEQAEHFARCVASVLAARHDNPLYWHSLRDAARDARFDWPSAANRYIRELYEFDQS
jgi:starch synthase